MKFSSYFFNLLAETIVDKAMELDHFGGTFGGNKRTTPFMCLTLKMLQIQPEKEIVVEFIKNEDYKYFPHCFLLHLDLCANSCFFSDMCVSWGRFIFVSLERPLMSTSTLSLSITITGNWEEKMEMGVSLEKQYPSFYRRWHIFFWCFRVYFMSRWWIRGWTSNSRLFLWYCTSKSP